MEGYFSKLAGAFTRLLHTSAAALPITLTVDCANGVGAGALAQLLAAVGPGVNATVINTGDGELNEKCGADFVKVQQCSPAGLELAEGERYASIDGDADRLVYYTLQGGKFVLLDGDRIAILLAEFISRTARAAGVHLEIGVVQTAYANGSSTDYIAHTLKLPVGCAKTGVKHLHHMAQHYDVGVYFEANGHGTVLFSHRALTAIATAAPADAAAVAALADLRNLVDLINQTVGDALSDMLVVEAVLAHMHMSVGAWAAAFADLPSRQLKVQIKDRTVVQTTDAERKCTHPAGLQEQIDALVAKYAHGRAFARPSGTEDVVRVYAEAATREGADELAKEVCRAVYDLAQGVGARP